MNAFAEIMCSLVVSAYKGLTSTLLTAQQSYALRPFFNAKIIDDTLQPNQLISSNLSPTGQGSSVTAPDGTILATGLDGSGNVVFYKGANLHTGAWDTTKIIEAAGGTFNQVFNNYSIQVSDYFNGTYCVFICYYEGLVNSGASNVAAKAWVSVNGGSTFTLLGSYTTGLTGDNYFFPHSYNLSIAAMKPRLVNNVMKYGFFTIQPSGQSLPLVTQVAYEIRYGYGDISSFSAFTTWSGRYVDSQDWTIQGLTTYYLNGRDYVVFSGYRNFIDVPNINYITPSSSVQIVQYGLWLTSAVQIGLGSNTSDSSTIGDVWSTPEPLFNSIAVSSTNLNSFSYPNASIVNGVVTIEFVASTVDSIVSKSLGQVTTTVSLMLMRSVDGKDFTYPQPFVVTGGALFPIPAYGGVFFCTQGTNYVYAISSGVVWEFIQNNIVADITNDVVSYSISETAGQPSSINIKIANQNNQWVGTAPTAPGASAIAGDRKIVLQQGYYNANGVPETVPRNVFFIDDITQNSSSSSNDLTIMGRDFYKHLKQTVTRWAYSIFGPFSYVDSFDGTTIVNWNQQTSGWIEQNNTLTLTGSPGADSNIFLSSIPRITSDSNIGVAVLGKTTGTIYVYAYYFDANNWLRLAYTFSGSVHLKIQKNVAGVTTDLFTSAAFSVYIPNGETHMVYVRQHDYYRFSFFISAVNGNDFSSWTSGNYFGTGFNVAFDLTNAVLSLPSQQWSVGLGANGVIPTFSSFQYNQFNISNSVSDILQRLATRAGNFAYNIQNTFQDLFFTQSNWVPGGDSAFVNRVLKIITNGSFYKNDAVVSDGEIIFRAKAIQTGGTVSGLSFFFRASDTSGNPSSAYAFNVYSTDTITNAKFSRFYNGAWYDFPSSQAGFGYPNGGINFDVTKIHEYRVVFFSGTMYGFIDDIMVAAWNDNTGTASALTSGYIGFGTYASSNVYVYNVRSNALWKQSPSFALNPGDDIESAVLSILQTIRAWMFSDLFGALKALLLTQSDTVSYSYQSQIFMQGVDTSNKEYVSQVTVYGNGVSATSRNTSLMVGAPIREQVIVDYTILTAQDAQTRADNEITNSNQYQKQLNPKQALNVGAELFDVVQVTDIGNNTSGVNTQSRVYAQKITTGNTNNEYSLEVDTGNV